MFRRTGRFFANFGSFRTRREKSNLRDMANMHEHAELVQTLASFGHVGQRLAEFLTNTQCSYGETRNILLDVDVG